jgi:hypothetical protein
MKIQFFLITFFIGFTFGTQAQTKNIQIRLNGVFMGECGNPNQCHHEPIIGDVRLYLASINTQGHTTSVPHTQESPKNFIWFGENYSLICDNIYETGEPEPYTMGDRAINITVVPPKIAKNIWRTFYYTIPQQDWIINKYQMRVFFNLGTQHQDNSFASVGEHWVTEKYLSFDFQKHQRGDVYTNLQTFGPYATNTDRCHQFWLQFQIDVR